MRYCWPENTKFEKIVLIPEFRKCPFCKEKLHICDHRDRKIFTLQGPKHIFCHLTHCVNPDCSGKGTTYSPPSEQGLAMPHWLIGWDVFAFIGHRRFSRHWSVSQIRTELQETYRITISHDIIENHIEHYQTIVAARHCDFQKLSEEYRNTSDLILSIDGLEPEKGHETLYVVREVRQKRILFAEPLLSSAYGEVEKLLIRAKEWAERLNLPVRLWISDKQNVFVKGIPIIFPDVPHRYCENHFLLDIAEPILEADSAAKVKMRKKIRGLRNVEKDMMKSIDEKKSNFPTGTEFREHTVMDYCSALRGILTDSQGGPLHPPGLKMAEGVKQVRESLDECLQSKKGGVAEKGIEKLLKIIDKGLESVDQAQDKIRSQVADIRKVYECLDPKTGNQDKRRIVFESLREGLEKSDDEIRLSIAGIMKRFAPGLFVGGDDPDLPRDNLDLERFFKTPKGHERRIHGHRHAGIRIVNEGPTLLPTLDAHLHHCDPFNVSDLLPYVDSQVPKAQQDSKARKKKMRKARSTKRRGPFLKSLKTLYCRRF